MASLLAHSSAQVASLHHAARPAASAAPLAPPGLAHPHQRPGAAVAPAAAASPCRRSNGARSSRRHVAAAAPEGGPPQQQQPQGEAVKYNTEFGYSRKDVLVICAGITAVGYALYYGLQAGGMEAGMAGNWVQLAIFIGICVFWVSTYLFRVATKQMTYVKQLEAYEDAVMRKRVEEMTEDELADMMRQAESTKQQ